MLETEYVIGNHDKVTWAVQEVIKNAKSLEDKLRAQRCRLENVSNGKERNALLGAKMCLDFLRPYGIDIPFNPSKVRVHLKKQKLKKSLPTEKYEDFVHLPVAKDRAASNASVFLGMRSNFAYLSQNESLCELVALREDFSVLVNTD